MISLVIPAFNEEKIIKNNVLCAMRFLAKEADEYEIIVVDDGSRDLTCRMLYGTGATVISMPKNFGKGAAVREGVVNARGDFVFFTDADLPYSLDFICRGVEMLGDCDVVCGTRFGDYPMRRRIVSAIYNRMANNILRLGVNDVQCGIKGFTRNAARQIFSICSIDGFAFDTEILFLARQLELDICNIEVQISHRSDSSVSILGDGLRMFADLLKIRNSFEAGEYNFYKSYGNTD